MAAKLMLDQKMIPYREVHVEYHEGFKDIRDCLQATTGCDPFKTVAFVEYQLIGDIDRLKLMEESGELQRILKEKAII